MIVYCHIEIQVEMRLQENEINFDSIKSQNSVRWDHAIGSADDAPPITMFIPLLQRPGEIPPF